VITRWVRLFVPDPKNHWDRMMFGTEPHVIDEAPKGLGREVRLATDAETGMYTRLALPSGSRE
jgi:hypothetical protein